MLLFVQLCFLEICRSTNSTEGSPGLVSGEPHLFERRFLSMALPELLLSESWAPGEPSEQGLGITAGNAQDKRRCWTTWPLQLVEAGS